MSQRTRSPIKEAPLRQAGQSLSERMDDIYFEEIFPFAMLSGALFVVTLLEWWRVIINSPPEPIPMTIFSLAAIGYSAYRIVKAKKKIDRLKLGQTGEKIVGEEVDNLRGLGFSVFHDIPGNNFNLDHVILSEHGIFIVETKTWSKPKGPSPKIIYDRNGLSIEGWKSFDAPLVQAEAEARWLKTILQKSTGKKYPVKAIIVFPGWYVEQKISSSKSHIWVLNPKGLAPFIQQESKSLAEDDLHLAAFHLGRYIRVAGSNSA